ncbi:DUF2268 domain-containing putative Zn-dependent protease [Lysinibacillus xylanilyticus]|uniref:DUF2268 domain-containing putative Zn-dependent protease n=1 Tax=Lysinibacillus xylanilyticus TaxID=582475 RepID=UPI002B24AF91|nr:DUF2268 domain-containing putative Zn-dependent protease [Lysinibacillus xylanilyticus]MEB2299410.1 DUF2268 domain-containing putative Zn-dependent protease [Lysinibacillus xylanilyticus]
MKKYLKIVVVFILIITCLALTACTQTEKGEDQQHEKEQKTDDKEMVFSFEHPQTKQKFKIIHVNQLFYPYIEKVKGNPNLSPSEILELYNREIIQPIYKDCFENGEYFHMAETLLNTAPTRLTDLQVISEKMDNRKTEINQIIQESLLKSADLLPSQSDVAVCVFPYSINNMLPFTAGAGKIILPYPSEMDSSIKLTVAHEYHHSVWAEKYFSKNEWSSVLDNIVFEGKAVMFGKSVYPDYGYTSTVLTYDKELWSKVEPDLNKYDSNRTSEILYGGKGLPSSYGYSEGYKMIKSYLDLNPNKTPEEWTALSAKEIFEKGNYLENYK